MLFPSDSTAEWCAKYPDLVPVTEACVVCDRNRTTTTPFIERGAAGLLAARCACGQPPESFSTSVFTGGKFDRLCYDAIEASL